MKRKRKRAIETFLSAVGGRGEASELPDHLSNLTSRKKIRRMKRQLGEEEQNRIKVAPHAFTKSSSSWGRETRQGGLDACGVSFPLVIAWVRHAGLVYERSIKL